MAQQVLRAFIEYDSQAIDPDMASRVQSAILAASPKLKAKVYVAAFHGFDMTPGHHMTLEKNEMLRVHTPNGYIDIVVNEDDTDVIQDNGDTLWLL